MKIAVCVKQIPDPATPYALDPQTHLSGASRGTDPRRHRSLRHRTGTATRRSDWWIRDTDLDEPRWQPSGDSPGPRHRCRQGSVGERPGAYAARALS